MNKQEAHEMLQHFTTFLQTHTYLVILIGVVLAVIMGVLGIILNFYKEEIKQHAKNKKLKKKDTKRIAEIEKMEDYLQGLKDTLLCDKIDNHDYQTSVTKQQAIKDITTKIETLKTIKGLEQHGSQAN